MIILQILFISLLVLMLVSVVWCYSIPKKQLEHLRHCSGFMLPNINDNLYTCRECGYKNDI